MSPSETLSTAVAVWQCYLHLIFIFCSNIISRIHCLPCLPGKKPISGVHARFLWACVLCIRDFPLSLGSRWLISLTDVIIAHPNTPKQRCERVSHDWIQIEPVMCGRVKYAVAKQLTQLLGWCVHMIIKPPELMCLNCLIGMNMWIMKTLYW